MYKNRLHSTEAECSLFCCPILISRCRFCSFLKLLSYRHTPDVPVLFLPKCRKALRIYSETPNQSARAFGERFWHKTRLEKRRNTLCISSFSSRRIGAKDPAKAADDWFGVSAKNERRKQNENKKEMASRRTAAAVCSVSSQSGSQAEACGTAAGMEERRTKWCCA